MVPIREAALASPSTTLDTATAIIRHSRTYCFDWQRSTRMRANVFGSLIITS
jgi:hypothetical protein